MPPRGLVPRAFALRRRRPRRPDGGHHLQGRRTHRPHAHPRRARRRRPGRDGHHQRPLLPPGEALPRAPARPRARRGLRRRVGAAARHAPVRAAGARRVHGPHRRARACSKGGSYLAVRDLAVPAWEPIGPQRANPAPVLPRVGGGRSDHAGDAPAPLAARRRWRWPASRRSSPTRCRPAWRRGRPPRGASRCSGASACAATPSTARGASVGPELNVPQSVVEYRPEADICAPTSSNPLTFRYGAMPAHPHLTEAELDGRPRLLPRHAPAQARPRRGRDAWRPRERRRDLAAPPAADAVPAPCARRCSREVPEVPPALPAAGSSWTVTATGTSEGVAHDLVHLLGSRDEGRGLRAPVVLRGRRRGRAWDGLVVYSQGVCPNARLALGRPATFADAPLLTATQTTPRPRALSARGRARGAPGAPTPPRPACCCAWRARPWRAVPRRSLAHALMDTDGWTSSVLDLAALPARLDARLRRRLGARGDAGEVALVTEEATAPVAHALRWKWMEGRGDAATRRAGTCSSSRTGRGSTCASGRSRS